MANEVVAKSAAKTKATKNAGLRRCIVISPEAHALRGGAVRMLGARSNARSDGKWLRLSWSFVEATSLCHRAASQFAGPVSNESIQRVRSCPLRLRDCGCGLSPEASRSGCDFCVRG